MDVSGRTVPDTVVAVDVGGSGVRAARLVGGRLAAPVEVPLHASFSSGEVEARIRSALAKVAGGACDRVGFCFPAFLDADGKVRDALNLPGLDGMDLAAVARDATGATRVTVLPDSAAAAAAEALAGAGRGASRALTVVVGTGCNAGMTVDGEVLRLGGGSLGDAGHGPVAFCDVECWCGGRGCLEAVLSGLAFARRARELGLADAQALLSAAASGHDEAAAAVAEAGRALGAALAAWSALLWPDVVVVGGGIGLACGPPLLEAALDELRRVGPDHLVRGIDVVASTVGRHGPLLGAGLSALAVDA
jgi:glucokinase